MSFVENYAGPGRELFEKLDRRIAVLEAHSGGSKWEEYQARNITAYAAENSRLTLALMAARSWIEARDYGKVLETSALTARADALAAIDLALKAPAHD